MPILLGAIAAALVIASLLLGLRRRLLRLPLGSAALWLRTHLWLGLLTPIFALAHSGPHLGGPLSTALTLMLLAAVVSGALGVALRRVITREISALSVETIIDLPAAVLSTRRRAYEMVWGACGAAPGDDESGGEASALRRLIGAAPRPAQPLHAPGALAGQAELLRFYCDRVLPFLRADDDRASLLGVAADAALAFEALEARLAAPLRPALGELRTRCERIRAARRQQRLVGWLHGWLVVHVPLSMAVLILLITHAVMALRY